MPEKLVEVKNVEISFGEGRKKFVAVHNANFFINKGETFSLVGESGSGKTTIADMLAEKYNLSVLKSYTTRPPRVNDDSHIFVSIEEFNKLENKIAYTEFNGNYYCATADQLDNSDIYVIDPDGIKYLKEHYHGSKRLIDI